jgi:hypothetical protein
MSIIIQNGQRMGEYYGTNGDSTFKPMPMPIIGAGTKRQPVTIFNSNTGVGKVGEPTNAEKVKRRSAGEVWDTITKTWKKVDESGIIDRTIDLFSDKNKPVVTVDSGGKVIVDDKKKDNTLYYVLGSALIVVAGYVAYKKLR